MSLCKGIQNTARQQLGILLRSPVVPTWASQTRRLSTFPLNHRFKIVPHLQYGVASSSRSYWWYSKRSTPLSTTTPVTGVDKESPQVEASQPIQNDNEATSGDSTSASSANDSPFVNNTDVSTGIDIAAISGPPPPLQIGDLKELGFCNWTPVGAVQAALEFVQVTTGLPWWGAILLVTGLTRLALLPFSIKQVRTTAAMAPVRPQMDALMAEVKEAKLQGDNARMQVAILKVRKLQRETGTGIGSVMTGPLLQASTSIVMFLAIKRLCDLPVPQIQAESLAWLPSLAAADPYYILPALSVAIMNLQIYLGRVDMAAAGTASLHFTNIFPLISIATLGILAYLPGGLLIYLVSNIALMSIQGIFLRNAAIRRSLKLPPLVPPKPGQFPSMRDTWVAIKNWFANQQKQAVSQAERRSHIPVFPAQSVSTTPLRRTATHRSTKKTGRGKKD